MGEKTTAGVYIERRAVEAFEEGNLPMLVLCLARPHEQTRIKHNVSPLLAPKAFGVDRK